MTPSTRLISRSMAGRVYTQARITASARTSPFILRPTFAVRHAGSSQKDAQLDREKINPEANETSKSGTDGEAAANSDAAFDPNPDPEESKQKAGQGNDVNPLDASPANPELSQGTSEEDGGAKKKMSEGGGGRQGGGQEGKGSSSV